jgi:hypothetical protein
MKPVVLILTDTEGAVHTFTVHPLDYSHRVMSGGGSVFLVKNYNNPTHKHRIEVVDYLIVKCPAAKEIAS